MKTTTLVLLFLIATQGLKAQEEKNFLFGESQHKIGFMIGYGNQNLLNMVYNYDVTFFLPQYYFTWVRREKWNIEVSAQPQFNLTEFEHINHSGDFEKGYEYGLNAGFLYRRKLITNHLNAYVALTSGPHYVSGTPDRQVPGFIFSDNLFGGFDIRITKKAYLDIRANMRHISNASIKQPNRGVNTFGFEAGFFVVL